MTDHKYPISPHEEVHNPQVSLPTRQELLDVIDRKNEVILFLVVCLTVCVVLLVVILALQIK